jgi:hypothetical protein
VWPDPENWSTTQPTGVRPGGLSAGEHIADALDPAATLHVRHLARGTSLTSRTLLAVLAADGPARPERPCRLAHATRISQRR